MTNTNSRERNTANEWVNCVHKQSATVNKCKIFFLLTLNQ